ncbi:MAG: hypothetical protein V1900_00240 [Candidatus Aenigmatarchaeota archaeon]
MTEITEELTSDERREILLDDLKNNVDSIIKKLDEHTGIDLLKIEIDEINVKINLLTERLEQLQKRFENIYGAVID